MVNQKKKRIYLSSILSDKKSIKEVIAGDTFICLKIDGDYKVYNLDGELQGNLSSEEYGNLLQVNEDSFILLKDSVITLINDKGEVAGSRELTEEELKTINESRTTSLQPNTLSPFCSESTDARFHLSFLS